jgi:hypothetical protein
MIRLLLPELLPKISPRLMEMMARPISVTATIRLE